MNNYTNNISSAINSLNIENDVLNYFFRLAEIQKNISEELFSYVETAANELKNSDKNYLSNIINIELTHKISKLVLDYSILWRDSIFLQQKAYLKLIDKLIDSSCNDKYIAENKKILIIALNEIVTEYEQLKNKKEYSEEEKKKNEKKKKLINPYKIYKTQIENVIKQTKYINEKFVIFYDAAKIFIKIKKIIYETINISKLEFSELKQIIYNLENSIKIDNITDINKYVENVKKVVKKSDEILNYKHYVEAFNTQIDKELNKLPEQREFCFKTRDGIVFTRNINFKNRLQQWQNKNIGPSLSEMWEIVEVNSNGLKMALQNLNVIINNTKETNNFHIISELHKFIKPFVENMKTGEIFFYELKSNLNKYLTNDLKITTAFHDTKYFLSSKAETSDKRINKTSIIFTKIKNQLNKKIAKLKVFREIIESEQNIGLKEKIVRFINERKISNKNSQYNNFFITKGYYGDTFLTERKNQKEQAVKTIQNWKQGFRGSILIIGKRLSGKTMFGESIAAEYFRNKTLRIAIGIKLKNKKNSKSILIDSNLTKTLKFINENYTNEKYLIWIDDIELWWDAKYTITKNILALSNFIDRYSDRFFVMTSINTATKNYISKMMPFDKVFQSQIYINEFTIKEIEEAIYIRHVAAQKQFLNSYKQNVNDKKEIALYVKKIYKISKGNIGQSLLLWAMFSKKEHDNFISFKNKNIYSLPDFLTNKNAIILRYIFLQKKTTEYRLHKMFGPEYTNKYANILKRMIGLGLIYENIDGWIEINETVLSELANMLHAKKYIYYKF